MNLDKVKAIFREEAFDLLERLESASMELGDLPGDSELIG